MVYAQTTFFGGDIGDVILSEVHCHGNESSLSECYHGQFGDVFCPGQENIAGIICADELSDLEIDAPILEQSVYLEDRQLYLLQCAMEENCVASEAYTEEFRADYRAPDHSHRPGVLNAVQPGSRGEEPFRRNAPA
ncbi:PREDICTED: lysyl oxidase homolog 2-like [Priapulus caudatus]|uniref:Lysyl oxidase homolog 2-like n=1 Tax=Priapulus caudatus TaxID=37621 RepID=A0ABM1EM74_PRICU|nr:PREDICTED: lysyl oxidase homolog 2-like [Priapulus caudatus]